MNIVGNQHPENYFGVLFLGVLCSCRGRVGSALVALIALFGVSATALAEALPEEEIAVAVGQLLNEFTNNRSSLQSDKPALYAMVDRITRPHFDFDKISKLVLAQSWKSAKPDQRSAFGEEFRKLLIRTYATALFQYTGKEKMLFKTSEIKQREEVKSAVVKSEVSLGEGPGIPVNYYMILGKDGHWKIYNMTIAGVNMVTNYRKTYGASIRSLGLDGLIESMKEANRDSQSS